MFFADADTNDDLGSTDGISADANTDDHLSSTYVALCKYADDDLSSTDDVFADMHIQTKTSPQKRGFRGCRHRLARDGSSIMEGSGGIGTPVHQQQMTDLQQQTMNHQQVTAHHQTTDPQ